MQLQFSLIKWDNNFNNSHFLSDTNIVNFSVPQKNICNFLPAFKNDTPIIVGILFPVPQNYDPTTARDSFFFPRNFYLFTYLFMPAVENQLPIVGIIFPVPQIMISANCWGFFFNVNTFFKWVPTLKSRVTYDLDTDLDTRHHNPQIIGEVGSPLYLATPVSTTDIYKNS